MTRLQKGLLIGAVAFLLIVGACSTALYFKVYKPLASPMMAMAISHAMDDQLAARDFTKPGSGEVTTDEVRRFITVEETVESQIGAGRAAFAEQQGVLERAEKDGEIALEPALGVFGALKPMLMSAKPMQIQAMNREHFSRREFEWVRDQLYRAAAIPLTRIDVSEMFSGGSDPAIRVRALAAQEVPPANLALALPLAHKLEAWRAFAFFGL